MDSDTDSSGEELKPPLEDIFILQQPSHSSQPHEDESYQKQKRVNRKVYNNVVSVIKLSKKVVTDEILEKKIIDELSGKNFPRYVKYFKSNYKVCLQKSMKSAKKSVEARIKGNELFAKIEHSAKIHRDIWELYSKSIAFAPAESKELVLAYECRSNLLLHWKEYQDCVKDIDRALVITEFGLLIVKLLCRKMTCFVAMGKSTDEKMKLWETLNNHLTEIDAAFKDDKFLKMIEQAKTDLQSQPILRYHVEKSPDFPATLISHQNNIDMVFNKDVRIVADRDFAPGEKVVVAKPLVISFNPNHSYAYCSHCLSLMMSGVPCHDCSLCMYCSEKCKIDAWNKYHILECKILPHINIENVNYYIMHMSIRVFLKGIKEYGSSPKLRKKMQEIDDLRDHSKLDRTLLDSDFSQFYVSLCTYVNNSNLDIAEHLVRQACFLSAYIIQTCDIFENKNLKSLRGKELSKNQDIVNLGFVMLKIMMLSYENLQPASEIYTAEPMCNKYESTQDCCNNRHCGRGVYFDIHRAMFEKSCNPNVAACWTDNGEIIYYCTQPIKKMEKITLCRYSEFFVNDTRNKYSNFSKKCQCTACLKCWPAMKGLYQRFKQRRLKETSNEAKIVQTYLERNQSKTVFIEEKTCEFNDEEYQQLLRDVKDVVEVYGQPSFASSLMIRYLCVAFEKRHGTASSMSQIPESC